jgi:hypothetical protein
VAVWTTTTKATRYYPTADTGSLVTAIASLITEASAIVHGDLSEVYWGFPDVTDTPATPDIIADVTAMKVGILAQTELGNLNRQDVVGEQLRWLIGHYQTMIDGLRDGERNVPQVTVSAEAMTFGTDPLDDNEYAFDPGALGLDGFEVVPESVRVSGFEYGFDFDVRFNEHNRSWVLVRHDSGIVDTTEVTYKISYRKPREKAKTPRNDTAEIGLA